MSTERGEIAAVNWYLTPFEAIRWHLFQRRVFALSQVLDGVRQLLLSGDLAMASYSLDFVDQVLAKVEVVDSDEASP